MKGVANFLRPKGNSSSKGATKNNGWPAPGGIGTKAKVCSNGNLSPRGSPTPVAKRHALYSVGLFGQGSSNAHGGAQAADAPAGAAAGQPQAAGQTQAPAPSSGFMNLRHTHLCPHCEKDFPNLSSLNKHLTSHSQERPHECIVCNKRFKRFDHLTSHMLTHRGEKPFQCPVEMCQKRYSDQRSLKRHMEKHHVTYEAGNDLTLKNQKWSTSTAEDDYECLASQCASPRPSPEGRWRGAHSQGVQQGTGCHYAGAQGLQWGGHGQAEAMAQDWGGDILSPQQEAGSASTGHRAMSCMSGTNEEGWDVDMEERKGLAVTAAERLGPEYQAVIPALRDDCPPVGKCQREMVWAPTTVAEDKQVDDFVKFAGSMAVFGKGWMPEYALSVLHKHGGHIKTALGILLMPTKKNRRMEKEAVVHWSSEERAAFEEGFKDLGKRFHAFNRYLRTKTTAQIIQYYYKWKRQEPEKYHQYAASHKAQAALPKQSVLPLPEPESNKGQNTLDEPMSPQSAASRSGIMTPGPTRHSRGRYRSMSRGSPMSLTGSPAQPVRT